MNFFLFRHKLIKSVLQIQRESYKTFPYQTNLGDFNENWLDSSYYEKRNTIAKFARFNTRKEALRRKLLVELALGRTPYAEFRFKIVW